MTQKHSPEDLVRFLREAAAPGNLPKSTTTQLLAAASLLERGQRDQERLDWLEVKKFHTKWDGSIGHPPTWHPEPAWAFAGWSGHSLRGAIDAARLAEVK